MLKALVAILAMTFVGCGEVKEAESTFIKSVAYSTSECHMIDSNADSIEFTPNKDTAVAYWDCAMFQGQPQTVVVYWRSDSNGGCLPETPTNIQHQACQP